MHLRKRLERLERKLANHAITLRMPDGHARRVGSRRLLDIFCEVGRGIVKDDATAIVASVDDDCQALGCGCMTDAIRIVAAARAETGILEQQMDPDDSFR